MGNNSSIEREDKIVTEVLVVLGEMGRDDLREGLVGVVEGWDGERKKIGDLGDRLWYLNKQVVRLRQQLADKHDEVNDLYERLGRVSEIGV
jgi:hypothetical protein